MILITRYVWRSEDQGCLPTRIPWRTFENDLDVKPDSRRLTLSLGGARHHDICKFPGDSKGQPEWETLTLGQCHPKELSGILAVSCLCVVQSNRASPCVTVRNLKYAWCG